MTRRIVGPFNRVEGDLEVKIDIERGRVTNAWVTSPLYRGFERMLVGKDPRDALVYAPRICGICSVSQSVAAATALRQAQGIAMAPNGERVTNLVAACENLADHLTHFYLFFMPDFARKVYARKGWYADTERRFKAVSGTATQQLLPARAQFMHLMGMLAGKWPHSLALQPGGTTRAIDAGEKPRLMSLLFAMREFLETNLFGVPLEAITAITTPAQLHEYADAATGDFPRFLKIADNLKLQTIGRAADRFMSYGAYETAGETEGGRTFKQGVWDGGVQALDGDAIREDVSHSWLNGGHAPLHPREGITLPSGDGDKGYTWCKAPRLDGKVVEVGAFARQLIDGQALMRALVEESGGNVRNRVVGRLFEVARLLPLMERWFKEIRSGEPFCVEVPVPESGFGVGMVEAARGSLGHWLDIRDGRIHNYQIVAPTTWNFSPRDANEQPGALEQALVNAPVKEGETDPVSVQHIVRSFDPCMVCTVH
ncbi:MAG: HupV protein [Gammaproteobacteria bacterium]|nr:HupV protein [Gammaproteobacteria bacterium]